MLVPDARFEVYSRHRDVSFQAQAWLLVLHVRVDHGIPIELLERMYLGMSPSGTKTWKLPLARWLFDVRGSSIKLALHRTPLSSRQTYSVDL